MLTQMQGGLEKLIACGGRNLRNAEKRWPIVEKEGLGVIWSVKHAHSYLAFSESKIRTDQSSLTFLYKQKQATGKLARWAALLQTYNFTIEHIASKTNPADALSRRPYPERPRDDFTEIDDLQAIVSRPATRRARWGEDAKAIPLLGESKPDLRKVQRKVQSQTHAPTVKLFLSS